MLRGFLTAPRGGPLLLLAAVAAGLPLLLTDSVHLNVATDAGLAAIACVGLSLLVGHAGQVSLGHGAFLGLGAYASAVLSAAHGWPPLLALLAGLAGTGVLAFLVAWPVLRPRGQHLAMATLGLGVVVSIALNREAWLTGGPGGMAVAGLSVAPGLAVKGARAWCWLVGGVLVVVAWLALNLADSPTGRALRALRASEVAAEVAGVDTRRHKVLAFVLSALAASLAGSLHAHHAGWITPGEAGLLRSIELLAMVVLGGAASVYGAVAGAAILTVLPRLFPVLHDHEEVVVGLVLMLAVILLPRGLVPTLVRAAPWSGR